MQTEKGERNAVALEKVAWDQEGCTQRIEAIKLLNPHASQEPRSPRLRHPERRVRIRWATSARPMLWLAPQSYEALELEASI